MKQFSINLILVQIIALFAVITVSQTQAAVGANPDINQPFLNPDFSIWRDRFERPGREVYDQRHKIVSTLTIKPGQAVADIGAGTGLFTRLFSKKVGATGKVYAIDISKTFIARIRKDARRLGLENIVGIVNSQNSLGLANDSIDLAFVCDTYHHFEEPEAMLRATRYALKRKGRLVIIDFKKQAGVSSDWVMQHVRANKQEVIQEISAQGFQLLKDVKILKANYFLVFEKI